MQLSTLIGKPILSPGGAAYGYVTGVRLLKGFSGIACLVCADDEEEEFYLPLRAVLFVHDAVIAGRARLTRPTGISSPIGLTVYSHTGEKLGTVADVALGEDAMLIVQDGDTAVEVRAALASIAETVIVYPDEVQKRAAARTQRPAKSSTDPQPKSEKPPKEPPEAPEGPPKKAPQAKPLQLNRTNLLGRRVKRSVYDTAGRPVALAGDRVTPAVLASARRAGRLLELAVNTLTKF